MKLFFVILVGQLLTVAILFGQCPERQFVWKRLVLHRDSSYSFTSKQQAQYIKEFVNYETLIKNCAYYNDSINTLLLQRIGAAYFYLDEDAKAIDFTLKSINIINSLPIKLEGDYRIQQQNYHNLANFYDSLSMIDDKNKSIDSCIAISIKSKLINESFLWLLLKRTDNLFNSGEYERCYSYAKAGEDYTKKYLGSDSTSYNVRFFTAKINALTNLENYDLAKKFIVTKILECRKNRLFNMWGPIYHELAQVSADLGDYKKSELYLKEAFVYYAKEGDNWGCMTVLNDLAYDIYWLKYHDFTMALKTYKKALSYNKSKSADETHELVNIFTNIANLYAQKEAYDSVFKYFQMAFYQLEFGLDENNILSHSLGSLFRNMPIRYIIELEIDKANAYLRKYETAKDESSIVESIRIYNLADQLLNKIKQEQLEVESKLKWRSIYRNLYENAIKACFLKNDIQNAFYFFEKSRAVLLADQLNEQRWVNPNDILEESQLKKRILDEQKNLNVADSNERLSIQNELIQDNIKIDHLQDLIKTRNSFYYETFIDTDFITLKDIYTNILNKYAALLEIFEGDSAVYMLTLTSGKYLFKSIKKDEYDSVSKSYLTYISNPEINTEYDQFLYSSRELYNLLFNRNSIPPGKIIICPDSHYFPFEALVTNNSDKNVSYFLNDHIISYTYSASYLLDQLSNNSNTSASSFMGVAPVNYLRKYHLPLLNGSDQSLIALKSYFNNSTILIRSDATKNNFTKKFSNYNIVQLYTHASAGDNLNEPVIYFSDTTLNLSELIPETKPKTSLIILSACETGEGKLYQGEGVFSFNRAFAAIGVPASIVNLWSAKAQSSYRLTELFYKYLSKGFSTDEALQKAKLEFMKSNEENKLPYYWANTILIGNANSFRFKDNISTLNILGYAALTIIALIILFLAIICIRRYVTKKIF